MMAEEKQDDILNPDGNVTMKLSTFLEQRETLSLLLKTTNTQKEFLKKFRKSMVEILSLAKEKGIDMDQVFDYYKNLEFPEIEKMDMVYLEPTEINSDPRWILTLKTVKKDEETSTVSD